MDTINELEQLAEQVKEEIRQTSTVSVGGIPFQRNSQSDSPYAGICHAAVLKLQELAPHLDIQLVSFERPGASLWTRGRHTVGEVEMANRTYIIDPTIEQFLPNQRSVYTQQEYPIKAISGTVKGNKY
jgi:hypothetical protein